MSTSTESIIHEEVRQRYAASARQVTSGDAACCGEEGIGPELYSVLERQDLPDAAVLASLGCGNPTAVAELREGERVLDLGSMSCCQRSVSVPAAAPSAWT